MFLLCIIGFLFPINSYADDKPLSKIKEELNFTQKDIAERGKNELSLFVNSGVWRGGYFEGNPQDPNGLCSYPKKMIYEQQLTNPLYVCYLECILPYVINKDVLELGPGRGAWSKAILSLNPKSFKCLDALSPEYNQFWNYVPKREKAKYFQIFDYSLSEIENNSIDYVFSFGVFCHISPLLVEEYLRNLYPKLRQGAKCFILYADYDKKNSYAEKYNVPGQLETKRDELQYYRINPNSPMGWYHMGINRMKETLLQIGYEVISPDVEVNERDPIAHFIRP